MDSITLFDTIHMDLTVLFKLPFNFIYNTFSKKFSILAKYAFDIGLKSYNIFSLTKISHHTDM